MATLWLVKTYGEQLKALRAGLGLTQEGMAERLGYRRQGNLSLYENGKKRPSVKTVIRHAVACGIKPSAFLKDVIVTEYDRVRAGDFDDSTQRSRPSGEATVPTKKRRHVA